MDAEELVAVFAQKPAMHRFPASMAKRVHDALRSDLVDDYGGDAEKLWTDVDDGRRAATRGCTRCPASARRSRRSSWRSWPSASACSPTGWEQAAGPFADPTPRSVADIDSPDSLREGPRVEEGDEGEGQDQAGLTLWSH